MVSHILSLRRQFSGVQHPLFYDWVDAGGDQVERPDIGVFEYNVELGAVTG